MDIINQFIFGEVLKEVKYIIMAHPSSVELPRYSYQFAFNTLRVFNILYASLLIVLYEPLTFFNILYAFQSLRAVNSLYESLVFLNDL